MTVGEPLESRVHPSMPPSRPQLPTAPGGRHWVWLGWLAAGGLIGALYWPTCVNLWQHWGQDPNYSHGYLVPLISAWLGFRAIRSRPGRLQGEIVLGSLEILAGSLVHLAALVVAWPLLDCLGLILVLRGLALAIGGRDWARGLTFPILFLFFMFPLPVTWTNGVAVWLQDVVSTVSAEVLNIVWVCYQRGNSLLLAGVNQPLVVGEECSGLRQIVVFLALAALVGHLSGRRVGYQLALLLSAFPVAVLANVIRVLMMAVGAKLFGVAWLEGWMHDLPGLLTLPLGFGLLMLMAWGLAKLNLGKPMATPAEEQPPPAPVDRRQAMSLGLVLGTLALAVALQWGLQAHLTAAGPADYLGLRSELSGLPHQLVDPGPDERKDATTKGSWTGSNHPEFPGLAGKILFADDLLYRIYRQDETGLAASVYMVFSQTGKDREHHPEICVRDVGGYPEDRAARATISLDGQGKRSVQRFCFLAGTGRAMYVYYWHYTLEPTGREDLTGIQALHQHLSRGAPSVTVQVTTGTSPAELPRFEKSLLVALDQAMQDRVLPASVRIGCERMPIRFLGRN